MKYEKIKRDNDDDELETTTTITRINYEFE